MNIHQAIQTYYGKATKEHDRYRSWEHCYGFFRQARGTNLVTDRDRAALQLAFYLASWGMYRGSSFLLDYDYTVHRGVIDLISDIHFDTLWNVDFGAGETDVELVPRISELIVGVEQTYKPFAPTTGSSQPTDTLITKVILGTFGCLPACDEYFIKGFKGEGFKYSYLNDKFIERILFFCHEHLPELLGEQASIKQNGGLHYPLMKLVDMYFWQKGKSEPPLSIQSGN